MSCLFYQSIEDCFCPYGLDSLHKAAGMIERYKNKRGINTPAGYPYPNTRKKIIFLIHPSNGGTVAFRPWSFACTRENAADNGLHGQSLRGGTPESFNWSLVLFIRSLCSFTWWILRPGYLPFSLAPVSLQAHGPTISISPGRFSRSASSKPEP